MECLTIIEIKFKTFQKKSDQLNRHMLLSNFIEKLKPNFGNFFKKGYAIESVNKINDNLNIILFTDNLKLIKISNLWKNVQTVFTKKFDNKNLENLFIVT